MIGRGKSPSAEVETDAQGFDTFELRLGDVMRGERATLAKSLLDVQRDLRIKASYIAGIENADLTAFEAPSFVAGYVRSYARYLDIEPDWAFERFCIETGYKPVHGLSQQAAVKTPKASKSFADPLANPNASFVPRGRAPLKTIEPRALGSVLVLALLLGGLGYGGYAVLQEVQRVQLAPVDQAPGVVAELDPLEGVEPMANEQIEIADALPVTPGASESADRIFRPQALDAPVLKERDGPISAIDPRVAGLLAQAPSFTDGGVQTAEAEAIDLPVARTLGEDVAEVEVLAVRPSWVRVSAADGTVLFEKVMDAGERFALPKLEDAPVLRTGESGAIYFAVNGQAFGPAGERGAVTKNIQLSPEALATSYAQADIDADNDLANMFSVANAEQVIAKPAE
ncbi:helix-turn-helix domain-containing protein [Albirhodobacter sp. R86504]|uniref:helix-turn-helix domain-containing protein n=1 Tax=Albirhodobacter sp. R86504 TaxID=3093848 RepID=UPI003670DC25